MLQAVVQGLSAVSGGQAQWRHGNNWHTMAESDAMRRERSGYWMSGFTTGPDTIMGILWSAGFIYSASLDATCHPTNNGLSSGADGQKCSPNANWNQSLFESVDGATCIGPQGVFGTTRYWHDPSLTGCAEAFTAYRALPEYTGGSAFTCNCSGSTSDHAYLGGPGGARASLVYLYAFNAATFSTAFAQLFVGTAVDYIDNRLRWWWIAYVLCTVFTLSMCVVGSGGIWIVGCIGSVFTLFFSEVVIPIRAHSQRPNERACSHERCTHAQLPEWMDASRSLVPGAPRPH